MNSNNIIASTLYSLVCLRNISINTLHKGDDDDDNKLAATFYTIETWFVSAT